MQNFNVNIGQMNKTNEW